MISISVSDLLVLPEFKGWSEWDVIKLTSDEKVLPFFFNLGLDINKGYTYEYNKHRNLQNKVVDGFRIIGEIRIDKEFRNSPFCTLIDKIIANSVTDVSFAMDLANRMGSTLNYSKFEDDHEKSSKEGFTADLLEPDYIAAESQINAVMSVLEGIRGTPMNDSGSLKTFEEWQGKKMVL